MQDVLYWIATIMQHDQVSVPVRGMIDARAKKRDPFSVPVRGMADARKKQRPLRPISVPGGEWLMQVIDQHWLVVSVPVRGMADASSHTLMAVSMSKFPSP